MMAFTERGFVWIKTIENKKQVNKEEYVGSRLRDNILEQEIKLEQIEKVFENAFLTKKEDWEIKAEKYLPSDGQLRELRGQQIQKNISDTFRIDSLKVFQENNDPNVIIEISWKNNIGVRILSIQEFGGLNWFRIHWFLCDSIWLFIYYRKSRKKSSPIFAQRKNLLPCLSKWNQLKR